MEITRAFSYLVHPAKHDEEQPRLGGTEITLQGNLYRMLHDLFEKSDSECSIDICFAPDQDGRQRNPCRDDIIALARQEDIASGRTLAQRLQSVTTHRSGMGLLFLIVGRDQERRKIVISRFPADFGILAEEDQENLRVEFLEKVFMRNTSAYKAVRYECESLEAGFWTGQATDKQINSSTVQISTYWVKEFLLSDFACTSAAGTKRLAVALAECARTDSLLMKQEIAATAQLARSLDGTSTSIRSFMERFALSPETQQTIVGRLRNPSLADEHFTFSAEEFGKHLQYRSVELDNGATLTAGINVFDDCFMKEPVVDTEDEFVFCTQGRIVDERLRRRK